MKLMRVLGVLFVGLFVLSARAYADPTISLQVDGGAIQTCADGAACDDNPLAGQVAETFLGGATVTAGGTGFVVGDAHIDLNSALGAQAGTPAHTYVIQFSEIGFTSALGFDADWAGTFSGAVTSVTAAAFYDPANVLFATPNQICSMTPVSSPFALSCSGGGTGDNLYSLTQRVTIVAGAGIANYSGDFELSQVPEPGTLLLISGGSALLLRRRRKNAAR